MKNDVRITTDKFPFLSATTFGDAAKQAILLIHGFPAKGDLWREVAPLLAEDFYVVVPDLPGVGKSTFEGEAVSMEALADGIVALLQQLSTSRAIVVGHSMGGYIALALAERHPSLLGGLSLVHSSAMADDEEKKNTRRKSIELIRKGGKEAFINAMVPTLFAPSFQEEHAEVLEAQRTQALQVADQTLIAFYNAMIERPERLQVLRSAAFPVQWVMGGQDKVIPPEKVAQQTTLANVNFVTVYQNSGHMAMLEAPERLAGDLGQFAAYCSARQTVDLAT